MALTREKATLQLDRGCCCWAEESKSRFCCLLSKARIGGSSVLSTRQDLPAKPASVVDGFSCLRAPSSDLKTLDPFSSTVICSFRVLKNRRGTTQGEQRDDRLDSFNGGCLAYHAAILCLSNRWQVGRMTRSQSVQLYSRLDARQSSHGASQVLDIHTTSPNEEVVEMYSLKGMTYEVVSWLYCSARSPGFE